MKRLFLLLTLLAPALHAQVTVNWTNQHQQILGFGITDFFNQTKLASTTIPIFYGNTGTGLGLTYYRMATTDNRFSDSLGNCTSVSANCEGAQIAQVRLAAAAGAHIIASTWSWNPAYYSNPTGNCPVPNPANYQLQANWVVNFLKSLNQFDNIVPEWITVASEPNGCWDMQWNASQIDAYVKVLGPSFAAAGLTTKIAMPEPSAPTELDQFGTTCATDSTCVQYVGNYVTHEYGGTVNIPTDTVSSAALPGTWPTTGKLYVETEASCDSSGAGPSFCLCGSGPTCFDPSMNNALGWAAMIDDRLVNANMNFWSWWWTTSRFDGQGVLCNDVGLGTGCGTGVPTGTMARRGYVLGQYARFIKPGYFRIDASPHNPQTGVSVSAYQNTSGSNLTIVATNYTGSNVSSQCFNITNAPTFSSVTPYITTATQALVQLSNITVTANSFCSPLPLQSVVTFVGTGSGASTFSLSVTITGGTGTVTGNGINCPGVCSVNLAAGTAVSLTQAPTGGSTFSSWNGSPTGCTVAGSVCSLTMPSANEAVAATFNSGNTVTAASCNSTDVQTAANLTPNGGTTIIPTGSCTWTSGVSVANKGISIIGGGASATPSGSPSTFKPDASCLTTILTDNVAGGAPMFNVAPAQGNSLLRVSCIKFVPGTGSMPIVNAQGACNNTGCPNFRMDNNTISGTTWNNCCDAGNLLDSVFGVADHNDVFEGQLVNVGYSTWLATTGSFGDLSWFSGPSLGSSQAFYVENNFIESQGGLTDTAHTTPEGGARVVCRFNQGVPLNTNGPCYGHGTETGQRVRGVLQMEFYGNNFTMNGQGGQAGATIRSGVLYSFGNYMPQVSGAFYNVFAEAFTERAYRGTTWGYMNGQGPYDQNAGASNPITTTISSYTAPTLTVAATLSPGAYNFSTSSPGASYYTVFDTTTGSMTGISSNGTNTITVSWTQAGNNGNIFALNPGDGLKIFGSTLYAAGTFNGTAGALDLTDTTKSWTANQWIGYSVFNVSKNFTCQITSNTATSTHCTTAQYGNPNWSVGDAYAITRPTQGLDQSGVAGGGTLFSGNIPAPKPAAQTVSPIYQWADSGAAFHGPFFADNLLTTVYTQSSTSQGPQTSPTSPFNGTSGTGYGTLANRPTTCTPAVGYYATDQGSWNTSGNTFPNQSFTQGVLYICKTTNTWTLSYTPFTYPHPLITGGSIGAPIVSLSPSSVAFGNVLVGSTSGSNVTLSNTGTATLNISSIAVGGTNPGDFSQSNNCGSGLTPGGNCTIVAQCTPLSAASFSANITITDNAAGSPHTIPLTCTGVTATAGISFSPTSLTFSAQTVGTPSSPQAVTVTNTGSANLVVTNVAVTSGNNTSFSQTNNCGTVAPAGTCTINVTFTPQIAGSNSSQVCVTDNAPGSPQCFVVSGTGNTAGNVNFSPASLTFPNTPVSATSAPIPFTATNSGGTAITISSIAVTGTNASDFAQTNNCGTSLAAGGSCIVNVTFTPSTTGSRAAAVTFTDTGPGSPQSVAVQGIGFTPAPAVTLSMTSLGFGNQTVATQSNPQVVVLTNSGTATLTVSTATLSGANTGDFGFSTTCGASLAVNASCSYSIHFTPTAAGSRSATFNVNTNAASSPNTVSLTGTGVASPPGAQAPQVFGDD